MHSASYCCSSCQLSVSGASLAVKPWLLPAKPWLLHAMKLRLVAVNITYAGGGGSRFKCQLRLSGLQDYVRGCNVGLRVWPVHHRHRQ
jgi:hypothetical protein